MIKTQKLYAVRNGSKIEQQNISYDEWINNSQFLLDNGFMVLVQHGLWSVLDSNGNVRLFKDDETKGCEVCC